MIRLLVRITGTNWNSYQHLVGTAAIAYDKTRGNARLGHPYEGAPLGTFLRLPAPDPLLGMSRYILSSNVEYETLGETEFDVFDLPEPARAGA